MRAKKSHAFQKLKKPAWYRGKAPEWHYLYHFWSPKTLILNRVPKALTMDMTLIFILLETVKIALDG